MLKRIRELLGGKRGRKQQSETAAGAAAAEPAPRPAVHHGPRVVHRPIPEVDLDPEAVKIVQRLNRFDCTAYLVGGCVRDLLLDLKPKDFDVGTSATPRQVKRLFRNCRIIGRRFRLAHIYFQNGKIIEVATFRARDDATEDPERSDLLVRDDNIFGTAEEDALRRDFTINSLFYDLRDGTVLDHADGLGDLRRRLVRCIGDPVTRFREDPIRCLRAIKFAARLDFEIEPQTLAALIRTREEISRAATPRVLEEINRMCRGGAARRSFELMRETGVLAVVLPEVNGKAPDGGFELTLDLLARMDSLRATDGRAIRAGEIFACLLLPGLAAELGWQPGKRFESPPGADFRQRIDARLQPLGLRLRLPRREQEYCQQTLGSLFRMVPVRRLRRGVKRAILRRECLADALWMLDVLADRWGAEFAESARFWRDAAGREPAAPQPAAPARSDDARPRRRSRRGRGRGSRGAQPDAVERSAAAGAAVVERAAAATPPANPPAVERKRDLPPVWDDAYFFAALPAAPDTPGEEGDDRAYGGVALATPHSRPATAQDGESEIRPEADRPRRRRRRRSRRGRGGGAPPPPAASGGDSGDAG